MLCSEILNNGSGLLTVTLPGTAIYYSMLVNDFLCYKMIKKAVGDFLCYKMIKKKQLELSLHCGMWIHG